MRAVHPQCTPSVPLQSPESNLNSAERARRGECRGCMKCRVDGSPHAYLRCGGIIDCYELYNYTQLYTLYTQPLRML